MSTKDKVIEAGRAVFREQSAWAKLATGTAMVYSTRDVHAALVNRGWFADDKEKQGGWKLLARLAEHEYPGVRRGAETQSAWKNHQRTVRPLEWHRAPTLDELTAWEAKVKEHKGAGPIASLAARVAQLEARVAELEGGK